MTEMGRYLRSPTQTTTRAVRPACNIPSCMKGSEARPARGARASATGAARRGLRLHRQQALALHALAGELAGAADRFRLLPGLFFRGLLVMAAKLHLAENPLALHLLLERLEGLIDVIIPDENLHAAYLFGKNSLTLMKRPAGPVGTCRRLWCGRVAESLQRVHPRWQ